MRRVCDSARGLGLSVVTTSTADPLAALSALPGVAEAVAETRAAVDRLRAHKVLRSRSGEIQCFANRQEISQMPEFHR